MAAASIPVLMATGAALGLFIGSFLATLVIRWPDGRGVVRGRSRCDGCGSTLSPLALIPLASFVALRGRCGACAGPIDRRHPAMELACAGIGAAALWRFPGIEGLAGAAFGWLLLTLAVLDVEHLWLPDRLTLPLAAIGLAAGTIGIPPPMQDRLIGMAGGFVLLEAVRLSYRLVRHRDGMGRGDPKLFGAIGAWLGWSVLPLVLCAAAGAGLVWAICASASTAAARDRLEIPFGAMLGLGAWLVWFGAGAPFG